MGAPRHRHWRWRWARPCFSSLASRFRCPADAGRRADHHWPHPWACSSPSGTAVGIRSVWRFTWPHGSSSTSPAHYMVTPTLLLLSALFVQLDARPRLVSLARGTNYFVGTVLVLFVAALVSFDVGESNVRGSPTWSEALNAGARDAPTPMSLTWCCRSRRAHRGLSIGAHIPCSEWRSPRLAWHLSARAATSLVALVKRIRLGSIAPSPTDKGTARRVTSKFSCEIAQAVSLDGVLLSMQSSRGLEETAKARWVGNLGDGRI